MSAATAFASQYPSPISCSLPSWIVQRHSILEACLLSDVPRVDGDDHVIQYLRAPQPAYLAIDLFGKIPVIEVSRQAVFRLDERDGLVE